MRSHRLAFLALATLVLIPSSSPSADEPSPAEIDQQTLKHHGVAPDVASLTAFIKDRTLTDARRRDILDAIGRLRANSFQTREKATRDLEGHGELAVPLLREAMRGAELDFVRRAERIIDGAKFTDCEVASAVARHLARQQPAEAAALLLPFLLTAPLGSLDDLRAVLASVAWRDGKPDAVLLKALDSPQPLLRGAAAEALVRSGSTELRRDLRKFLRDPDATVRLRAALGFAAKREKEAVPVLIALLGEMAPEQAWEAEEVLYRLAGEEGPRLSLGRDAAARKKCAEAWAGWWAKHGERVDLARLAETTRLRGYTLLVQYAGDGPDRVMELGPDGKERWRIENLNYPVDAQVLPGDRVLLTEYTGNRVTERDLQGKVLWEKALSAPVTAQRLPNGHTLIATHTQILEFNAEGKEVFTYNLNNVRLCGCYKPRNGPIAFLTSAGDCIRLDETGKEIRSFKSGHDVSWVSGFEVLPNGHILMPQRPTNKVVEFDADGKVVWEASVAMPKAASRLPNGHTLVASFDTRSAVEIDRAGKVLWEHKDSFNQYRAKRR